MATKSRYKVFTATTEHPTGEWVEYYLRTSGDIVENGVTGTHNYITEGQYVSASLVALDTAVKAAYDHVPANVLTSDSTLNSAKLSGLIPNACLPDYIFGQLVYGGDLGANALASLTNNAKQKLGTTSNTITLTNNTASITGYEDNEGIYYIVAVAQTFAGISFNVGDWLVSNGTGWAKIDNTDAIAMWCGLTGNITTVQAKTVLGGSIASGNDGFATGGDVYTAVQTLSNNTLHLTNNNNTLNAYEIPFGYASGDGTISPSGLYLTSNRLEHRVANSLQELQIRGKDTYIIADAETYDSSVYDGWLKFVGKGFQFKPDSEKTLGDYTGNSGIFYFGTYDSTKDRHLLTDYREYIFPDKSGTVAMTSDVPTFTVGTSQPSNPKTGDVWIDTTN